MGKVRITQIKSTIDRTHVQKATLKGFGIKKVNGSVELEATPQILGMIKKVQHLIKVENI
ncbi:MAG TPA: 50S ribosomal protein L30 [Flavobacteriales bacterium]|nr:50S ribosomal protein L30 [Flavobacteriales bacterium]